MAGCTYFTSLDVVSAFWQVFVAEPDIHRSGFCTPFGNFEWLHMPFGLVNASLTFQRLMDRTSDGCSPCSVAVKGLEYIVHEHNMVENRGIPSSAPSMRRWNVEDALTGLNGIRSHSRLPKGVQKPGCGCQAQQ